MNDITIPHIQRMRALIVHLHFLHTRRCLYCKERMGCAEVERLFRLLCFWTHRLLEVEWQTFDRESEEAG